MTELSLLDPEFKEQLTILLSQAHHAGSDVDAVFSTAGRIIDGDADSWVLEWLWTAGDTWAAANAADSAGSGHRLIRPFVVRWWTWQRRRRETPAAFLLPHQCA
jgi:hypothetical protein